jgi:hypothetical protein
VLTTKPLRVVSAHQRASHGEEKGRESLRETVKHLAGKKEHEKTRPACRLRRMPNSRKEQHSPRKLEVQEGSVDVAGGVCLSSGRKQGGEEGEEVQLAY